MVANASRLERVGDGSKKAQARPELSGIDADARPFPKFVDGIIEVDNLQLLDAV